MNFTHLLVLVLLASFVLLVADLVRPTFSSFLLGEDAGRIKSALLWIGLGVVSFVLIGIFGVEPNDISEADETMIDVPNYEIVNVKDISTVHNGRDVKRFQYWVHVKDTPSVEALKKLARTIVKKAKNKRDFNALSVKFIPHEHLSGSSHEAIYAPDGDWSEAINVTTGNYSAMDYKFNNLSKFVELKKSIKGSEKKFGLSEKKRKQAYYEIAKAEKKARVEAEEKHPTDLNCVSIETQEKNQDKKLKLERELMNKYRNEVYEKYEITDTVATKIVTEGINKKWKSPPVKKRNC